jgi:hypothetical protein
MAVKYRIIGKDGKGGPKVTLTSSLDVDSYYGEAVSRCYSGARCQRDSGKS